jgi:hypothetical protein
MMDAENFYAGALSMRLSIRILASIYALTTLCLSLGCQTQEDGQLRPMVSNPEIALPIAIANEFIRKSPMMLRGEISQDPNCMRHYPISRLLIHIQAMDGNVKTEHRETTFHPNDRVFQQVLDLDPKSQYRIQLIHEPGNTVLFEKKTTIKGTLDVFFRIQCPQ